MKGRKWSPREYVAIRASCKMPRCSNHDLQNIEYLQMEQMLYRRRTAMARMDERIKNALRFLRGEKSER